MASTGAARAPTVTDRLLLALFRRYPPTDPIFKDPGPRAEIEHRSEVESPLARWFGRESGWLAGRDVLDLGCGYGGRAVRLREAGARSVTGIEIAPELVEHARAFAAARGTTQVRFLVGSGERIPCADASFDWITMMDVLEHVVSPREVLAECLRVLVPGGRLAVVFPPYYELTGGSHLHGYATSLPGLNLVFSTAALRSAARHRLEEQGIDYARWLRQDVPTDKLWNQNGLTVRGFRRLVRASGFAVEEMRFIGELDHRLTRHAGLRRLARMPAYALFELLARVPFLQEVACNRVCAILRKPLARVRDAGDA